MTFISDQDEISPPANFFRADFFVLIFFLLTSEMPSSIVALQSTFKLRPFDSSASISSNRELWFVPGVLWLEFEDQQSKNNKRSRRLPSARWGS